MQAAQTILLERRGRGALGREEALMEAQAHARGVPVRFASVKQVERNKCALDKTTVAIGSVPFVKHALRQLGRTLPEHIPYPDVLRQMLHREVRKLNTLREARVMVTQGRSLFIKPAEGWKRFSGFVSDDPRDMRFNGASSYLPVWISEPVTFASEWRAYVAHDKVLDVRFVDHGGDRGLRIDRDVVDEAVRLVATSGSAPAGYVIDFGVLHPCGKTALIEMNDGFSFGAYDDVAPEVYWDISISRWAEMVQ